MQLKTLGFTLFELLTALIVLTILISIAIPSFHTALAQQHSMTAIKQLQNAINLARSEAIKRGVVITLCKSADQHTCSGHWHDGQILFIDQAKLGKMTNPEDLLAVYDSISDHGVLSWKATRSNDYLQFAPDGTTYGQAGTFLYCPANGDLHYSRALVVSQTGRTRLITADNNSDIPKDENGKALICE